MKIWKKLKKFSLLSKSVEFVSLNVAYRLTEYDTESLTKDYNLPFIFAQKYLLSKVITIQVFVSNLYSQVYSPLATTHRYLKLSFSEKAIKLYAICLMVLTFTISKCQNHETDCANFEAFSEKLNFTHKVD